MEEARRKKEEEEDERKKKKTRSRSGKEKKKQADLLFQKRFRAGVGEGGWVGFFVFFFSLHIY